jgi:hypothetical protein
MEKLIVSSIDITSGFQNPLIGAKRLSLKYFLLIATSFLLKSYLQILLNKTLCNIKNVKLDIRAYIDACIITRLLLPQIIFPDTLLAYQKTRGNSQSSIISKNFKHFLVAFCRHHYLGQMQQIQSHSVRKQPLV